MDLGEIFHLEWLQKYKDLRREFLLNIEENVSTNIFSNSKDFFNFANRKPKNETAKMFSDIDHKKNCNGLKRFEQSAFIFGELPSFLKNFMIFKSSKKDQFFHDQ